LRGCRPVLQHPQAFKPATIWRGGPGPVTALKIRFAAWLSMPQVLCS
jgi:hypothetical protein